MQYSLAVMILKLMFFYINCVWFPEIKCTHIQYLIPVYTRTHNTNKNGSKTIFFLELSRIKAFLCHCAFERRFEWVIDRRMQNGGSRLWQLITLIGSYLVNECMRQKSTRSTQNLSHWHYSKYSSAKHCFLHWFVPAWLPVFWMREFDFIKPLTVLFHIPLKMFHKIDVRYVAVHVLPK